MPFFGKAVFYEAIIPVVSCWHWRNLKLRPFSLAASWAGKPVRSIHNGYNGSQGIWERI